VKLEFTSKAEIDLLEIWVYNADRYGIDHAEMYRTFLLTEMFALTKRPLAGKTVDDFPHLRYLIMRRRAGSHGHVAYYEVDEDVVRIMRVLHTSMDVSGRL